MFRVSLVACLFMAVLTCPAMAQSRTAAILGNDPALTAQIEAAGYTVRVIDEAGLCDAAQMNPESLDLLIIRDGKRLPDASVKPVRAYLEGGGDLIAMNAPIWRERLVQADGQWTTIDEYQCAHAPELPPHVLYDFSPATIEPWQRSCARGENKVQYETLAEGPAPGIRCLHASMNIMDGWETFGPKSIDKPFPDGDVLTVFSAKGGPNTALLSIEWVEEDGSRWLAVVPLGKEWKRYVLSPADFHFWESVPSRANTQFQPQHAKRLAIGLSFSHTGTASGPHEYWVSPFGTAPASFGTGPAALQDPLPLFDTICPTYKFFDSTGAAAIVPAQGQFIAPATAKFTLPAELRSPQPRPGAGGFDKGRNYRWMPILEARTDAGAWRGTPAALIANTDGPWKGGVWACLSMPCPEAAQAPEYPALVRSIAARMADPVFIVDGGADHYTYFDGQAMRLGLRVANAGKSRMDGLTAKVLVTPADGQAAVHVTQSWNVALEPGETGVFEESWTPDAWPENGFTVSALLTRSDVIVDRADHDVFVWRPKAEKHFVTAANGQFQLDGQRWRPHGVNYMPSSGIGLENGNHFESWIGAGGYDPEIIQRDLEHVKDLGLNSVSIFIYRDAMEAQNLLDLLRRLDALGLKANLSLRPGTPLDFRAQEMRELIEYYRLWEQDAVFALDLAWEPMFLPTERTPWDAAWAEWILERYGSFENAEKDWGFPVPRNPEGKVINIAPEQIEKDGPWNRMVAAYRRFLDTLLYEKYGAARRFVRALDPNHAISFRMTVAGDPTCRMNNVIPYDFAYLAGAVDCLEPEAYGRIGDWERVKPGWFTHAYGRWARPELPLFWGEAGLHAWDLGSMTSPPSLLDQQAAFYQRLYRLFIESGCDGIFFWWYPGGYRTGENSDYGIINPDGSDRPVSKVIRELGPKLLNAPDPAPIDAWIEMDRDRHVDGLAGIYDDAKTAFWAAIEAGKTPGLKTAASGTDSANCPLDAVGNVPCNGTNPPKYLDGAFDLVEIKDAQGNWVEAAKGAEIHVSAAAIPLARVTITNLNEAQWLAPGANASLPGGVSITAASPSGTLSQPIPQPLARFATATFEVPLTSHPIATTTEIRLSFNCQTRTPFGPKHAVKLIPE